MTSFTIKGGRSLNGSITPQGAKNEALQVISATLLTKAPVTINNVPDIRDVNNLMDLLKALGVSISKVAPNSFTFQAKSLNEGYLDTEDFFKHSSSLRGSVLILGPLLHRFKRVKLPQPGGDKIGRRRLDTHFQGLQALGAKFEYNNAGQFYSIQNNTLTGAYILLDEASVTGTANLIMASAGAKGQTTIYNAACEPYIQQLCHMLNRMGARISGIGSNLLRISGVQEFSGTTHRLLPDMIEIGSFIGMAAMTQSEITIKDAAPQYLGMLPMAFKRLGIQMFINNEDIVVPGHSIYEVESFIDGSIMSLADAPWPGISPDLLSILLVVATQARGSVLIHQKMFESRLFFVDKLLDMGAKIILCDPHRATVIGLERKHQLRATNMVSPDIRAGVALLIAALSANGTSRIENIAQIDRGYEKIDDRLRKLGAQIQRE